MRAAKLEGEDASGPPFPRDVLCAIKTPTIDDDGETMNDGLGRCFRTIALIALAACKGTPDDHPFCSETAPGGTTATQVGTYYDSAYSIIQEKCVGCHRKDGTAPFTLEGYADVMAHASAMREQIAVGAMPPWLGARCCTEYFRDYSLTSDEKVTLLAWLDAGAPEGKAPGMLPTVAPAGGLSRVDVTLKVAEPYLPAPTSGTDDTRCFLIPWPEQRPRFITGLNPVPGNRGVLHHLVVGALNGDGVKKAQALERKDGRPGIDCPGGFGDIDTVQVLGGSLLGGDFPRGIGVPVAPGSMIILSIHYSTAHQHAAFDQSSIQFKVDDHAIEAKPLAFLNLGWVIEGGMSISAGDADATYFYRARPEIFTQGRRVRLQNITPHLHEFASKIVVRTIKKNGDRECLVEIPKWRFGWEHPFWFANEKVLDPEDELYIECHFDNSASNQKNGQAPRDIAWGGNNQEMCVAFLSFTEE